MSTMTLGEAQKQFFECFVQWAAYALAQGYRFTFGEAKRSNEQAEINALGQDGRERVAKLIEGQFLLLATKIRDNGEANGIRNSGHGQQLALDLNLFRDGVYLFRTQDWQALGEHWESLHPLACWGGRFSDGNHLSFEFGGIK